MQRQASWKVICIVIQKGSMMPQKSKSMFHDLIYFFLGGGRNNLFKSIAVIHTLWHAVRMLIIVNIMFDTALYHDDYNVRI